VIGAIRGATTPITKLVVGFHIFAVPVLVMFCVGNHRH
jgi:hypothetical protein